MWWIILVSIHWTSECDKCIHNKNTQGNFYFSDKPPVLDILFATASLVFCHINSSVRFSSFSFDFKRSMNVPGSCSNVPQSIYRGKTTMDRNGKNGIANWRLQCDCIFKSMVLVLWFTLHLNTFTCIKHQLFAILGVWTIPRNFEKNLFCKRN